MSDHYLAHVADLSVAAGCSSRVQDFIRLVGFRGRIGGSAYERRCHSVVCPAEWMLALGLMDTEELLDVIVIFCQMGRESSRRGQPAAAELLRSVVDLATAEYAFQRMPMLL